MKVNKAFLRTVCGVGIVLISLLAKAQDVRKPSISKPSDFAQAPSTATTSKHKTPAGAHPAATATGDGVIDMGKLEIVAERYPDGKVKVEREVGQDTAGNYVNQGTFKQYAPTGEIVKAGEFLDGRQQGKWTQQIAKDLGHLFSASQDKEWSAPFTSEATFQDGRLHGVWTIKDSRGQNIVQWCFENGIRAGTWTWWYSNGRKRLEATYLNGALNGEVLEWDRDGKTSNQSTYIDGKCVVKIVGWYTLGQKRYEGTYLRASDMMEATYDWWNSKIATSASAPTAPDQKHGVWTEWYPGGSKKTEAQYDRGIPVGKITWWYENGQEQAEGEFEGGQRSGVWITWHPNGLKQSLVEYKAGKPVTKELAWSLEGKLIDSQQAQDPRISRTAQRPSTSR
jgi:antitoxin component YwqK of YwqJK toxin-antitoxin module